MDLDKYQKIIDNNPAESFEKSINTKQAWMKYGNNFKQGMKRRSRIDKLTGNDEDKFKFKELTKKDYSASSTKVGKVLYKFVLSCKNLYKDI